MESKNINNNSRRRGMGPKSGQLNIRAIKMLYGVKCRTRDNGQCPAGIFEKFEMIKDPEKPESLCIGLWGYTLLLTVWLS